MLVSVFELLELEKELGIELLANWQHYKYYFFKIKNKKNNKVAYFRAEWEYVYSAPQCDLYIEKVKCENKEWVKEREIKKTELGYTFRKYIKQYVIFVYEKRREESLESKVKLKSEGRSYRYDEDLEECFNESYF